MAKGGQFALANRGQFTPVLGGQFNWIFHAYSWDDWKIILNRKQEEKEKQKFDKKRRKQRKQNVGDDALDS